jgi:hypothetical protein
MMRPDNKKIVPKNDISSAILPDIAVLLQVKDVKSDHFNALQSSFYVCLESEMGGCLKGGCLKI